MTTSGRRFRAAVVAVALTLGACGPQAGSPDQRAASGEEPAARGPKVLTVAISREPTELQEDIPGAASKSGSADIFQIAHDSLVVRNPQTFSHEPRLALEMPSVERGTWRVNTDGTMDVTWRIHPNARWHDGTPLTSTDLAFAFQVYGDPDIPSRVGAPLEIMHSVLTPDPHTLVVHWNQVYVNADEAPGLNPMPRHLLEDLYRTDKANLPNSPRFSTEFVGLGPYRLTTWERGSHIEFARFDDYYRGRPPLDRVILRFIGDANARVTNILAEQVDVVMAPGVSIDAATEVQQRWQGTGNQVLFQLKNNVSLLVVQFRPQYAQPRNGLTVLPVRQAVYHAIDRQALSDSLTQGLAPPADSWLAPTEPLRRDLEASIPQFPYDPARASQLLAGAGWQPGPDSVLTHAQTGDRFDIEIRGRPDFERHANIIAAGWKAVGARPAIYIIPQALAADRSQEGAAPGAVFSSIRADVLYKDRLDSRVMMTAENRWTGKNTGGYVNPRVDALLDRLNATIDQRQRIPLHRDLLREQMGDVAVMPLHWSIEPTLAMKGVTGIRGDTAWNIFEWDKR